MQTRRDQLHAYQFMTRRAMAALMTGEPDVVEPPMRRLTLLTISGVMIAILVAVVFLAIGLISPGGSSDWDKAGTVVIERETGAIFVVRDDGRLQPALNYASAVLAVVGDRNGGSSGKVDVQLVPRKKVADKGRVDAMIGDPSLPSSVPSPKDLVTGPVTLCSTPDHDSSNTYLTSVRLTIGKPVATVALKDDEMLLVATPTEDPTGDRVVYALSRGLKFKATPDEVADYRAHDGEVIPVGAAFLNAIPTASADATVPLGARPAADFAGDSPCASYDDKGGVSLSTLSGQDLLSPDSWPTHDARPQTGKIGSVDVAAGAGLVARSTLSNIYFLIANSLAYPAGQASYLAAFGYTDESKVELPQELLSVIPGGAPLDPSRAVQTLNAG